MVPHDDRIFLTSTSLYRSPEGAVAVLSCGAIAMVFLLVLPHIDRPWQWPAATVALVLLGIAGWVLLDMVRNKRITCVLDQDGVNVDGTFWRWEDVASLSAVGWPDKPQVDVRMKPRSEVFEVELMIRPRLTPRQYEALVERLRQRVAPRYPSLQIGGYDMDGG